MPSPRPYPQLARSFDLPTFWMLRMLQHHGALARFASPRGAGYRAEVFDRLGIPDMPESASAASAVRAIRSRLAPTLARLEARQDELMLPDPLAGNIALLQTTFDLSATETWLLAIAVLMQADPIFQRVAAQTEPSSNLSGRLADLLGVGVEAVIASTRPTALLRRCGLVDFTAGGPIAGNVSVTRGRLRMLAQVPLASTDELLGHFLAEGRAASLSPDDFSHLDLDVATLAGLVGEAVASGRCGVNLLLYGPPGTGKTELSRLVAQMAGARAYEVAHTCDAGKPLEPVDRLNALAAGGALLAGRHAVLCFDETDALFLGAGPRGASAADKGKAWLNDVLESLPVPAIWIANSVRGLDPAVARRFDAILHVEVAPRRQRLALIEKTCAGLLPPHEARALADVDSLTPAVVTRAAAVARRVLEPARPEPLVRSLIEGVLRAQGHGLVGRTVRSPLPFDPSACNADVDLAGLARALRDAAGARLCLAGPPGTGKSEFGRWLAEELGRPHYVRRLSDLQSPWVGETERAIARAFEQARREHAVLQFDEVDSLLSDRRTVTRSWEVNQVNEFLTQLEGFDGVLVSTTNRFQHLDPAAMRRFDYRIQFDYLDPSTVSDLARRCARLLDLAPCEVAMQRLAAQRRLTPGDFAVAMRRQEIQRARNFADFVSILEAEAAYKPAPPRRIGLV